MINVSALVQLKAFARQDGLILAVAWLASFVLVMFSPQTPYGNLLAIATPFIVGWRLTKFRDNALDGVVSFRRAFAYSCYTFFYASLVFAMGQYIYFRFIDNGQMSNILTATLKELAPIYREQGIPAKELDVTMTQIAALRPIELAIVFMMQNLTVGLFLSLPIAMMTKRRKAWNGQQGMTPTNT